jgi:hypothetical protein
VLENLALRNPNRGPVQRFEITEFTRNIRLTLRDKNAQLLLVSGCDVLAAYHGVIALCHGAL